MSEKVEQAPERLTIDLTPLEEFKYNQISNYKFEYMLVNQELKVVHSPFECKDYLQDIFWCEHMGKTSSIYGLKWSPGMFDVKASHFYLAMNGGKEVMSNRINPMREFINQFEEKLGIEPTVIYETENEKIIVLRFSRDWTISGPMLSAYTTLIRVSGGYESGDALKYLIAVNKREMKIPDYSKVEQERLGTNLPKLAALYEGKRPDAQWSDVDSVSGAHSYGIYGCHKFPKGTLPKDALESSQDSEDDDDWFDDE